MTLLQLTFDFKSVSRDTTVNNQRKVKRTSFPHHNEILRDHTKSGDGTIQKKLIKKLELKNLDLKI